jgi:hypothetical protein
MNELITGGPRPYPTHLVVHVSALLHPTIYLVCGELISSTKGVQISKFRDGKMVERWGSSDQLGMLQQLGVTQSMTRCEAAALTCQRRPAQRRFIRVKAPHGDGVESVSAESLSAYDAYSEKERARYSGQNTFKRVNRFIYAHLKIAGNAASGFKRKCL